MTLNELPIEEMNFQDLPFYHRGGKLTDNGNTYIRCGQVKTSCNPYAYTEEKQCCGHICRVLMPSKVIDRAHVIRDDGTVWTIYLSNFEDIALIKIKGRT